MTNVLANFTTIRKNLLRCNTKFKSISRVILPQFNMPQGRRKIPFSGKQKKQQLINKRQDKGEKSDEISRHF
jgi:hypothetical protein